MALVDIHAHFFNVLYIPVEGILQRYGAPDDVANWVGKRIRDKALRDEPDGRAPLITLETEGDFVSFIGELMDLPGDPPPPDLSRSGVEMSPIEMWRRLKRLISQAEALFAWLGLMTGHESRIVSAAHSAYPAVTQFVHHLMSLDSYYDLAPPEYGFEEQVDRILEFAPNSIGFVAFDPALGDQAVGQVEHALEKGFRGVKFYPPNGYRPRDNVDSHFLHPDLDPVVVDKACRNLFELCVERDLPVLAHCSIPGFEARTSLGMNAHPENWGALLEDSAFSDLRLCLAHAGGSNSWLGQNLPELADQVIELCAAHPNVYCEFGHFEEIVYSEQHCRTVKQRLETLVPLGSQLERKVMFGTDWHIVATVESAAGYLSAWEKVLDGRSAQATEAFFGANALEFIG